MHNIGDNIYFKDISSNNIYKGLITEIEEVINGTYYYVVSGGNTYKVPHHRIIKDDEDDVISYDGIKPGDKLFAITYDKYDIPIIEEVLVANITLKNNKILINVYEIYRDFVLDEDIFKDFNNAFDQLSKQLDSLEKYYKDRISNYECRRKDELKELEQLKKERLSLMSQL